MLKVSGLVSLGLKENDEKMLILNFISIETNPNKTYIRNLLQWNVMERRQVVSVRIQEKDAEGFVF